MSSMNSFEMNLDVPLAHQNRKYLFLTLENGLRCFLINDPSTDLVSGAVVANTGNFNDPPNVPGIAHLAEHIMMRGSRKGRNDDIDYLIASSGGSFNAYTSAEKTCFYFEISTYAENTIDKGQFVLDSFLSEFATRLAKPNITEKAMKLEITAVDDEHNGNRCNIDKIYLQALRLLANPMHPFSRFGCGNISTLTNVSLEKTKCLVSSHIARSFRPPNMVLVLKGPQTIMHLRKLVAANFSDLIYELPFSSPKIANTAGFDDYKKIPLFGESDCLVVKSHFAKGMRMLISLKNIMHLENYGPVLRLLCNLIGDESNDTLCDSLKRKLQWVNEIYVFIQEICQGEEMLVVEIDPTIQGHKRLARLRDAVLFYIEKTIAEVPRSQLIQLALDFAHIEEYNYLNHELSSSAVDEVCEYGERIIGKNLEGNDLIKGFKMWNNINDAYDTIQFVIKTCFTERNWKIIVLDEDFKPMLQLGCGYTEANEDKFFDFQYMSLITEFGKEVNFDFEISKTNKNMQKLVPIVRPDIHSGRLTKIRDLKTQVTEPKLLSFDNTSEIWFQQSSPQNRRRDYTVASICIKFPHIPTTPKNIVILELLAEIIGRELKPRLYHLELVGSDWGIYSNINGSLSLLVNLSGMHQTIQKQTKEVFLQIQKVMKDGGSYDYNQVKGPRKALRERYDGYIGTSGMKRVFGASYIILEENLTTPEERIEALELIDSSEIERFLGNARVRKCHMTMLVCGSISEDECYTLFQLVKINDAENVYHPFLRENSSAILDNGTKIFKMLGLAISAVMYYLQVGERTYKHAFAKAKIFEYLMAITINDQLRRNKGLAYGFLAGIRIFRRTFGLYIALPSGVHSCEHIINELEEYLGGIESMLDNMSKEDYQNKIFVPFMESLANDDADNKPASGLFSTLEPQHGSGKKPTSVYLKEHWGHLEQILNGTYNFKSRDCEEELSLSVLHGITLDDMRKFVKRHISVKSQKRSALIICNDAAESDARQKMAAKVLAFQLRQLGCTISEEAMAEILRQCSDQSMFSDMIKPLQKHFSRTKQGTSFMKFRLKYMVGSTVRKTKEGWSKNISRMTKVRWSTYTDYKEIQRYSSIAPIVTPEERRERLHQILVDQWE